MWRPYVYYISNSNLRRTFYDVINHLHTDRSTLLPLQSRLGTRSVYQDAATKVRNSYGTQYDLVFQHSMLLCFPAYNLNLDVNDTIYNCADNVYYLSLQQEILINLQATKLFIVTYGYQGGVVTTPLRFRVRFKILYRVIQPLIQHCLLHKMVYLNIIMLLLLETMNFLLPAFFCN